jgi:alanine racemase
MSGSHASVVEVSRSALANNLRVFKRLLRGGESLLAAVVKANAYGHGLVEVARLAADSGVDWLAVDSLDEARRLREAGIDRPLLLMGYLPLDQAGQVPELDLKPTVFNLETLDALDTAARQAGRTVAVHLKLETGTCRQGFTGDQLVEAARRLQQSDVLVAEGVSSHFANIEDTTDHTVAFGQLETFHRLVEELGQAGVRPPIRHVACSAAALLFKRTHLELVRVGVSLYGFWPSRETMVSMKDGSTRGISLQPALSWKTRLAQVKEVPAGTDVGYGCTFRTTRPSRLAVIPVGYYDGFDRGLSNVGHVLVRGQRAPVRGRVCMNMTIVDVTDIPGAGLEDEAVLIGRQGDELLTADMLAAACSTIHYEIVSRIHPEIPRVLVD